MGARMATLTGSFTNLNSVYGKLFCVHYWAHVYTYTAAFESSRAEALKVNLVLDAVMGTTRHNSAREHGRHDGP